MTTDLDALARDLVASPRWRWLAMLGSRTLSGGRVLAVCGDGVPVVAQPAVLFGETPGREPDALPDLHDPATIGCLAALAREAWARRAGGLHAVLDGASGSWEIRAFASSGDPEAPDRLVLAEADTEAEAWARAWLGAP